MYGRRHPFLVMLTGDEAGGSGSPQDEPEQTTNADAEKATDTTDDADADDVDDVDESDGEAWDKERALRKIRKANAEAKALRERAKAAEEAAKATPDLKAKNTQLEAENLRLQVALELGLPAQIASRLQGGTREELLTDAEEFMKLLGTKTPPTAKSTNGFGETHTNTPVSGKPIDLDELAGGFMN
ncbi:MAG: hypothetical protein SPG34_08725 [Trueperella sp.]|uniref:hypothetical protein n=1 Tax=Trueperella sp. TaxID=2699835 RepID=UPI002A90A0F0|nr:hypothetical protein [Trueperella sp.]MDY5404399.1 hypothetical protein [Trueperella sp.]